MTKFIAVAILLMLSVSCSQEEKTQFDPYTGDLSSVEGSNLTSSIHVSLTDFGGSEIVDLSQVQPNTRYKIKLTSSEAEFIRIKNGDGYKLLSGPSLQSHAFGGSEYIIVTSSEYSDQIYINIVPIHKKGEKFLREHSQVFLLPQL